MFALLAFAPFYIENSTKSVVFGFFFLPQETIMLTLNHDCLLGCDTGDIRARCHMMLLAVINTRRPEQPLMADEERVTSHQDVRSRTAMGGPEQSRHLGRVD